MISSFVVHLQNHSYNIQEKLKERGLTELAVISLEQFTGAGSLPQRMIRIWYRDGKVQETNDEY
jgi:hypothetical protein